MRIPQDYSDNALTLSIDDLPVTIRDVKEAQAEMARVLREYVDTRVQRDLAEEADVNDSYYERKAFEKAQDKLNVLIDRVPIGGNA